MTSQYSLKRISEIVVSSSLLLDFNRVSQFLYMLGNKHADIIFLKSIKTSWNDDLFKTATQCYSRYYSKIMSKLKITWHSMSERVTSK